MRGILKAEYPKPIPMSSLCCCPSAIKYDNMVTVSADGGTTEEKMPRASLRQALAAGYSVVGDLPTAEVPHCLWSWNEEPAYDPENPTAHNPVIA